MDQIKLRQTGRICRLFIADSNLLYRKGVRTLLTADGSLAVIGEAATAAELLDQMRAVTPDLVIVDAGFLPDQNDREAINGLREAMRGRDMLVLARADQPAYLASAVACGAKGYILKTGSSEQLRAAVRNIAFGDGDLNDSGMIADLQALAAQTPAAVAPALTSREMDVVKLLAAGKTVRTVAIDLALSPKTIEAHKLNLMRKLDIHDRASLIAYATRTGLLAA